MSDLDRSDIAEKVLCAVLRWREKHQPSCAESIYQVDDITIHATDLVEDCMSIVGYDAEQK